MISSRSSHFSFKLGSEYIAGIRKDVEGMKNKLANVVAVLEEWQSCQQKWESLVPIFGQYEVQRQLSQQTNKFRVVDRRWRATIRNAQRDPKVLSITSSSGLMSTLAEANKVALHDNCFGSITNLE